MREKISLMTFPMEVDMAMKKMTAQDCLRMAKEEGIGHVDVLNPTQARIEEYVAAGKETGVKPWCYIGTVSFFSREEAEIRRIMERQLRDAATLGARLYMIVPVEPKRDERACARLGENEVRSRLKKYFSTAMELAQQTGIRVCFETTPQDYTRLSGIEDCRWVLEQVPGLGLVYDTANMLPHGDDPLEYYEALKPYIVHTHAKDVRLRKATWKDRLFRAERTKQGEVMVCCVSGSGVIPLRRILRRMETDGYQELYALEYSHPEKYPANCAQNSARLKEHMRFWEDVSGEAAR